MAWLVLYPPGYREVCALSLTAPREASDDRKVDADGCFHYSENHQWSLMELLYAT
jgi:hypothetical protein